MFDGLLKSIIRISSFITKEFLETIRRPGALLSLVLGPFVIMGLFGLGYSGQYRALNAIVVVPSSSGLPTQASFYQQYTGPSLHIAQVTSDAAAARAALVDQRVDMVVIAPNNVEANFRQGKQSQITIQFNELDPVRANYARYVADQQIQLLNEAIIRQAVSSGEQYAVSQTGRQVVNVPPQVVAAPTTANLQNVAPISPTVVAFFAPAVLALVLQHMGVTLTGMSLVRERLGGMMDMFRVAPIRSMEILIGKYLAYAVLNLGVAALVSALVVGVLHVPLLSSPGEMAAVVALLTFASMGMGLLIASIVDSERQAVQLSMLVLLASVFFSGFVLPLDEFQPLVRDLAYLIPVTHGIALLQDVMLRGGTNRAWELYALGGLGIIFFLASALTLRRSMAAEAAPAAS